MSEARKIEGLLANTVDRLINSVIDDALAAGATVTRKPRKKRIAQLDALRYYGIH